MTIKELIYKYNDKDPNYQGELANHLNMAMYALDQMGASEEVISSFADSYTIKMELEPMRPPSMVITSDNYRSCFGKKETYSAFVLFYKNLIQETSKEAVLQEHVDLFADGFSGDAFHGLIRLAYAVLLDDEDELAKALAYMAQTYMPFEYKKQLQIIDNPKEHFITLSKIESFKNFEFQRSLIAGRMHDLYDSSLFHEVVRGLDESLLSFDKLIPLIVEIYGRTLDFTMLHGLTSTHALLVLEPYFKDIKEVLQQHFYHLQLAYLSTKCTPIGDVPEFENKPSWQEIFAEAVKSSDPHTIKVIYSMQQISSRFEDDSLLRTLSALKVNMT